VPKKPVSGPGPMEKPSRLKRPKGDRKGKRRGIRKATCDYRGRQGRGEEI